MRDTYSITANGHTQKCAISKISEPLSVVRRVQMVYKCNNNNSNNNNSWNHFECLLASYLVSLWTGRTLLTPGNVNNLQPWRQRENNNSTTTTTATAMKTRTTTTDNNANEQQQQQQHKMLTMKFAKRKHFARFCWGVPEWRPQQRQHAHQCAHTHISNSKQRRTLEGIQQIPAYINLGTNMRYIYLLVINSIH